MRYIVHTSTGAVPVDADDFALDDCKDGATLVFHRGGKDAAAFAPSHWLHIVPVDVEGDNLYSDATRQAAVA